MTGLHTTFLMLCDQCLDGAGGECHTPGCALWMNRAPDLPLRDKITALPKLAESPDFAEHMAGVLFRDAWPGCEWPKDATSKHRERYRARAARVCRDLFAPAEGSAPVVGPGVGEISDEAKEWGQ